MKRTILLAALAASFNLQAVTLEARNNAGGKIVLTLNQGPCPQGEQQAYSTSPSGNVQFGCWLGVDQRAFVRYNDGSVRVYEPEIFTLKEPKKNE